MTNAAYKGMGALVLGWGEWQALITPQSMNGAFGVPFPNGTVAANNTANFDLQSDPDSDDFSIGMEPPVAGASLAPPQIPTLNAPVIDNQIASGAYVVDPVQQQQSAAVGTALSTRRQPARPPPMRRTLRRPAERVPRGRRVSLPGRRVPGRPGAFGHRRVLRG